MNEPVTAVLLERIGDPRGAEARMYTFSLLAHGALVLLLLASPALLGPRTGSDAERVVMRISLGGAPGPRAGGMTPMGGRPIQQSVPSPERARPEPVRPPAAKTPAMTLPDPDAKRATKPRSPVKAAPDEARGAKPTTGPEQRAGSSIAETGGRGTGFGLSTGGGGTGGYLDVGNFCCPDYLITMLELIRRNWNSKQDVPGEAMVKFTIERDGRIVAVQLERSSGFTALDLTSQRALLLTRQIPPLPAAFTERTLTVHLNFQYQR